MGFGIVLSILFEPEQIAYFVYLYTIILVVGHDIGSSNIIRF